MSSTISPFARRLAVTAGCFLLGSALPGVASGFYPNSFVNSEAPPAMVALDPRQVLPKLSTLGAGFEYRYRHSARINMRAEWFTFEDTRAEVSDDLQSELLVKLQSRSMLFDWFPFEGRFRATAGIYFFSSDVTGSANYTDPLSFAGANLTAAEVNSAAISAADKLHQAGYGQYAAQLEQFAAANTQGLSLPAASAPGSLAGAGAKLHSRPYAPYVGFGWANAENKRHGWFYSIDLGVIYLGRPRVEYNVSGPLADALRSSYGADIGAWIEQEERATEERLSKYRYFPVLSLGLSYGF